MNETSPYLLQHADNPVEWYPWGPEALEAAREQNKPIFLSIGYSACHWCHVMAHESFESEEIAKLMNDWFINVKVDREERPDLDQIYMSAVVAITGSGGWPMSVFLTPTGEPFYGGTYWPSAPKFQRPGFPQVLAAVNEAWTDRNEHVHEQADKLTNAIRGMDAFDASASELSPDLMTTAEKKLVGSVDQRHGGFGSAPKFPHPFDLRVLLRCYKRSGNADTLAAVTLTLDKMAAGGIYDHLGGGFHRYSTDAMWLAPHFEKMLYDNALLVPAYLEAYQTTGNAEYARIARETLDYTLGEMTDTNGGFYSTQDADSEGEEGKFFVWTLDEIHEHLGPDRAEIFAEAYDVTPNGNWEEKTILNRTTQGLGFSKSEADLLAECRQILYNVREQRIKPGRDEKILTSWNGLMIAAMALGARVLGDQRYAEAAENSAAFLLETLRDDDGSLLHSFKDGRARFNGYLDDYACLIDGLVELYQTTFNNRWIEAAVALADRMQEQFADDESVGFFYTSRDHEELIVRQKDSQDNATPSGNAMAATALLKLSRLTGRSEWEDIATRTLEMLATQMTYAPSASGQSLIALDFLTGPTRECVLFADSVESDLQELNQRFVPNKVVVAVSNSETTSKTIDSLVSGKTKINNQPTLYVCEHGTCSQPVVGVDEIRDGFNALS
ncbi:thioredoxin domain-containing protein [Thalassoroseus pseudoceratinae]|uniref:thioredoxin domain-containing protein n=1 Tax=Thalassoroseus pseudoceratinae TaxID=2713176 RepID=UPI00197FBE96|nr:thioredoxin domain-containing protein [Thalassoroseus pseudoceratinae]